MRAASAASVAVSDALADVRGRPRAGGANGKDYLLSWNCKHIANAMLRGRIEATCRAAGYEPPVICTPLELVEE